MSDEFSKLPRRQQWCVVLGALALLGFLYLRFAGVEIHWSSRNAINALSGKPAEDDGQRVIEEKIQAQSAGKIRLLSFVKTDGEERDLLGSKAYLLHFEAKLEFLENCQWGPMLGSRWQGEFRTDAPAASGLMARLGTSIGKRSAAAGSKVVVKSYLVFRKTENGWQGDTAGDGSVEDVER